jgi:hypothetical protein
MGAQFKSKTHLLDTFFDFWRRSLRVWLQSLKKVLILPKQFSFLIKKSIKKPNFMLISNPLKSFEKMHQKSDRQNKFDEHE